jgi:hypothetical protein
LRYQSVKLADEIEEQYRTGRPFTEPQRDYLLSEAVINMAGGIPEAAYHGDIDLAQRASQGDFEMLEQVAKRLGFMEHHGEGMSVSPVFQSAVSDAAHAILLDLTPNVVQLGQALAESPGEWIEDSIQYALAHHLGSPCGSHRHILEGMRTELGLGQESATD